MQIFNLRKGPFNPRIGSLIGPVLAFHWYAAMFASLWLIAKRPEKRLLSYVRLKL